MKTFIFLIKGLLLVLLLCVSYQKSQSQSKLENIKKTDSLRQLLTSVNDVEKRKDIVLKLIELNYLTNAKLTISLCEIIIDEEEVKADPLYFTRISILYGIALNGDNQIKKSISVMENAVPVAATLKTQEGKKLYLKLIQNIGANLSELGFVNLHIQKTLENLPLLKEIGDPFDLYSNYFNLALSFSFLQDYNKAITYLQMANDIYKRDRVKEIYAGIIDIAFASTYFLMGERDSVIKYVDLATASIHDDLRTDLRTEYNSLYALANIYRKNYTEAKVLLDKEINRIKQTQGKETDYLAQLVTSIYFEEMGQYNASIEVLNELIKRNDEFNDSVYKEGMLYRLANMYDRIGKMELAVNTFKELSEFTRQVKLTRDKTNLEEWDYNFRYQDKLTEIDRLKIDKERVMLKSQRNQLLVIVLVASIVVLVIIGYLLIWNNNRKKEIREKELLLLKASLAEKEQNLRINKMQLMHKVEERERNRIGTDLHDSMGGLLSAIKIAIHSLMQKSLNSEEATQESKRILNYIDESKHELNRIVYNLTPMAVERFGLTEAIKQYCKNLQSEKLRIDLQILDFPNKVCNESEITIYRIIQEMIHNIIKHAEASYILLQLQAIEEGWMMISVEDDGIGMDVKEVKQKHGLGMKSLYARVQELGGSVHIKSKPQEGTGIYVTFNMNAKLIK